MKDVIVDGEHESQMPPQLTHRANGERQEEVLPNGNGVNVQDIRSPESTDWLRPIKRGIGKV